MIMKQIQIKSHCGQEPQVVHLILLELFTKSMPLVPKSYSVKRGLKTGTENWSEILGVIVVTPL